MLNKTVDVEEIKEIERQWHNEDYAGDPLDLLDVGAFEAARLSPCYTTGKDRYSDNKMEFHNLIAPAPARGGKASTCWTTPAGSASGRSTTHLPARARRLRLRYFRQGSRARK